MFGRTLSPHAAILPETAVDALVESWLAEDCPGFDHGAAAAGTTRTVGYLYQKSTGVLAGVPFFCAVFRRLGCTVTWDDMAREGVELRPSKGREGRVQLAIVEGPAHLLLRGERVALNVLAECSGVATAAKRAADVAKQMGWRGRVAATRKTTPGFRLVQMYGIIVGGMDPHRLNLASMVMLKDNHLAAASGVVQAVRAAKATAGFSVKIEVECGTAEDAIRAAKAGADVVMLDNFRVEEFADAARRVKDEFPNITVEGSGGLGYDTLRQYMIPEVDVLSFSVNRYATAVDMSLKIEN